MPVPFSSFLPLIGTAFNGLSQIGSSILGRNQTRENYDTDLANQQMLAQQAHERDIASWHRNNKYNSPKAQMARLKAAGLNPHLIYGTGNIAGNTQSQMPKYQQIRPESKVTPLKLPQNLMNEFMALKQMQSSNDLTTSQAKYFNEKAITEEAIRNNLGSQTGLNKVLTKLRNGELDYQEEFQNLNLDSMHLDNELKGSKISLQDAQTSESLARKLNIHVSTVNTYEQYLWNKLKNDVYADSKINIDKDDILIRQLEPLITFLSGLILEDSDGKEDPPGDPSDPKDTKAQVKHVMDKYYNLDGFRSLWQMLIDNVEKAGKNPANQTDGYK